MARPATGSVVEREGREGVVFALRFRAYGERQYLTLGAKGDGWSKAKAEAELRHVLADVERGIWTPPVSEPAEAPTECPTFHQFASEWMAAKEPELKPKTITDYRWALELHLLPFFKDFALDAITAEVVDRYKAGKLREGKIAPNAINKTLDRLSQVLEVAEEYGHIERNYAKGKNRKAKRTKPKRTSVQPEQLMALIESGDRFMRPVVATLAGTGLRIGELCSLDWRDVNLATGTIIVRESKTAAGEGREVDLSLGLQEELTAWKQRSPRKRPGDPVFVSGRPRNGVNARQTERNVQARLATVLKAANKRLKKEGIEELGQVTPHSLRRAYASLRAALRDDPVYIAEQGGWKDPRFVFSVYQRAAKRREKLTGRYRSAFDAALDWARMGTKADSDDALYPPSDPVQVKETESESQK